VHEILITHIAETEAVMKELTHLITPAEVVSWLCSSVKARTIRTAIYGEEHQSVAASQTRLGNVCCYLGKYREAKEHHEKAVIIAKKVYGEQPADVAGSYNNLGIVYHDLGQHRQTKEHHEKALIIRRRGTVNSTLMWQTVTTTYSDLKQYVLPKEFYENVLNIYKAVYGEQHAAVERTYRRNLTIVDRNLRQATNKCCII